MPSVPYWQWKVAQDAADLDTAPVELPPAEA